MRRAWLTAVMKKRSFSVQPTGKKKSAPLSKISFDKEDFSTTKKSFWKYFS